MLLVSLHSPVSIILYICLCAITNIHLRFTILNNLCSGGIAERLEYGTDTTRVPRCGDYITAESNRSEGLMAVRTQHTSH